MSGEAERVAKVAAIILMLAGCGEHDPNHFARLQEQREQRDRQRAYDRCLFDARGYFGTASIEVIMHCETRHPERTTDAE